MDKEKNKTMSDTVKNFVSDTMQSLGQNPIAKGLVPTVAGTAVTFMESLEISLRITSVSLACIIGILTVYVKGKEAIEIYKNGKKK